MNTINNFDDDEVTVVYSIRLVKRLTEKGFIFKKTKPNKFVPNRFVFYYVTTPELEQEIENFKKERKEFWKENN